MNQSFRISLWNANGLINHVQELKLYLTVNKIDIMLISETHFTDTSFFKVPNFSVYFANHPDNRAHGGSAVIIRSSIKHYELPSYNFDHIQASSVVVEDWTGPLTISAIYCPPRHNINHQQFTHFFGTLGPRFVCGGDYNAKHQLWGSRLHSPRGRQLFKSITDGNMSSISTGAPTYWPSDLNKIPDVLDIFVSKGISDNYFNVTSSLDLHSDHSPIILTISSSVILKEGQPTLCNKNTDWNRFRGIFDNSTSLKIPLKSPDDIDEAVEQFNISIQNAAWKATIPLPKKPPKEVNYPIQVKQKIAEKRRLRRVWQNSRNQIDKTNLNRAAQQLKRLLCNLKNEWFEEFTASLSPFQDSNYSLWKVTKSIRQPKTPVPPITKPDGSWTKSDIEKADVFANYFHDVFQPFPGAMDQEVIDFIDSPNQLTFPIDPVKPSEVKAIILSELNSKKAPGYDLITGKVLKEMSRKGFIMLTLIFNAILRLEYFPTQWKVANIIVIHKPGKPNHQTSSYRPISLLPIVSKVFEKALLKRLKTVLEKDEIIPHHQFGFRPQHSTTEQVHRVVNIISNSLENNQYCSAVFLDVRQAFDKVWHPGLLFKVKSLLPHSFFNILKSYLENRHFQIKFNDIYSTMKEIHSGVPQGSVLGPILYSLYTYDIPVSPGVTLATFADDTALLATHDDAVIASRILQDSLNDLTHWFSKWRIKINEAKSVHLTCTLKHLTCPVVYMNNIQLPQVTEVKYLGIHIDRRLTWHSHVWNKRLQLNTKFRKLSWLLNRKSHLSVNNKLLIYKTILKPIWTYGIQLWGTTSNSNIKIIQRFQSKCLRNILQAPWYINNNIIHNDTKIPFVEEEIKRFSTNYIDKLYNHSNYLAVDLLDNGDDVYRLKRHKVLDLPFRF